MFPFSFLLFSSFFSTISGVNQAKMKMAFFSPMIPMFMNCEHLGAFCVCYALFVMFNYYPFMLLYVLSLIVLFYYFLLTVSCEKRIKPTVWVGKRG